MLPSWLKTMLIIGGIVAVIGVVVFLWLLVKGADMRRKDSLYLKKTMMMG